jgi:hypothetical protein
MVGSTVVPSPSALVRHDHVAALAVGVLLEAGGDLALAGPEVVPAQARGQQAQHQGTDQGGQPFDALLELEESRR